MYLERLCVRKRAGGRVVGRIGDKEYKNDKAPSKESNGLSTNPLCEFFSAVSSTQAASCQWKATSVKVELFTPIIAPMRQLVTLNGCPNSVHLLESKKEDEGAEAACPLEAWPFLCGALLPELCFSCVDDLMGSYDKIIPMEMGVTIKPTVNGIFMTCKPRIPSTVAC